MGGSRKEETGTRKRGIAYRPLPSQEKFHASTARFKGFSGPIGSGKSQALCQEAIKLSYLTTNGLPPADPQFRNFIGMPFYDAWTAAEFLAQYGRPMTVFTTNDSDPASFPDEAAFLPTVLGNFTTAIMTHVRSSQPACRFEVLYPGDVNHTTFNQTINFPAVWTPASLDVLKTECFGFTFGRDLNQAEGTILASHGFPAAQRSHLVGIGDSTAAWLKEVRSAAGKNFESVVLFALDQFCLIGYAVPLSELLRRSLRMSA